MVVTALALTSCVAEQMDVHEGTATVREAMRFSAYLRQPFHVLKEEKDAYVEDMLELLELQDLSEAMVCSLGVEARKRLTIGVELASKPELLLFLDEPTSGLDAQSAWNLVRFLRKLADSGQAILCTIHQPSSLLFESFDRLLLLGKGGNTIYFGDIGNDSDVMREYFARNGAPCPQNVNPAEYMLEAIGAGITPRIGDRDWKDIWLDSPECARTKTEIEEIKREASTRSQSVTTKQSMCKSDGSKSSLVSLLSCASRCDTNLVPAEGSRATEYNFVVEIARLCLHTTLLASDRVALCLVAVPSTWEQRARPSISHFWDVSIVLV
jgi:ABC-type multidrug transport system ATPase subunit